MRRRTRTTYETVQPWVLYHYGRTHDLWWPFWNSTRVLGRACIVAECVVCGDRTAMWLRIPRIGPVPDRGHHPMRLAYLERHRHADRGHVATWVGYQAPAPPLNFAALNRRCSS